MASWTEFGVIMILISVFLGVTLSFYLTYRHRYKIQEILMPLYLKITGFKQVRSSRRLQISLNGTFIRKTGKTGVTYTFKTRDISETGMYFMTETHLEKGEELEFELCLSEENVVQGVFKVMWVQNKWSERHRIGVGAHFTKLLGTFRQRLQKFILKA